MIHRTYLQHHSQHGQCATCGMHLLAGDYAWVLYDGRGPRKWCSVTCWEGALHRRRPSFRSKAEEKAVAR